MLLVLYGSVTEVGDVSRDFLIGSGFELIEKFNCATEHVVTKSRYRKRKLVSEEEFIKQTDSLFRYEVGGIRVGFNQEQILEAVGNDANKLLTLSSPDVSLLREIKQVYGDAVQIIYCYINESALESIVKARQGIETEEAEYRIELGKTIRRQYSLNSGLFDHVVIYNGEQSEFDSNNLLMQYKAIIDSLNLSTDNADSYDVFLSYAKGDMQRVNVIREKLEKEGIKVFSHENNPSDVNFFDYMKKIIYSSKAVVPIITQNAVKSEYIRSEIGEALRIADESAVVVIPIFLDSDVDMDESYEIQILSYMHGVICDDGDVSDAGEKLALIIKILFTGLDHLEWYSEQVNSYIFIKKYDEALELQTSHRDLCIELYNTSHGKYVSMDAIINSEIKLISILIDMKEWNAALDEVIEALKMLDDDSNKGSYDALIEQFAICCEKSSMTEDEVASIIKDSIDINSLYIEYSGKFEDQFNFDLCEDLMNEFKNKKKKAELRTDRGEKENDGNEETVKIAQHGEAAMKIFNGLMNADFTEQTRGSMIEGYQRVLNYCMQLGLSEEISSECIKKIAELKEAEAVESSSKSELAGALKVFLGLAAPGSGNYDVFISFKSEDEELARKVYNFLRQNGKEVFFSKESLTQLGESEYEDAIYSALDHSKHFVLVGSNPEYFKTDWVSREWKYFNNKNRKSENKGNIVIVLPGEYATDTGKLPPQLRYDFEIIKFAEFKDRLLSYMR